jgi:transcriptional regulator with XRE-family HTH domain
MAAILQRMFSQRLAAVRHAAKISQAGLAERTQLSAEFISRLERGVTLPSLESLMRLCDALDCTPNDLLVPSGGDDRLEQLRARIESAEPEIARDVIRVAEAVLEYEVRRRRKP